MLLQAHLASSQAAGLLCVAVCTGVRFHSRGLQPHSRSAGLVQSPGRRSQVALCLQVDPALCLSCLHQALMLSLPDLPAACSPSAPRLINRCMPETGSTAQSDKLAALDRAEQVSELALQHAAACPLKHRHHQVCCRRGRSRTWSWQQRPWQSLQRQGTATRRS